MSIKPVYVVKQDYLDLETLFKAEAITPDSLGIKVYSTGEPADFKGDNFYVDITHLYRDDCFESSIFIREYHMAEVMQYAVENCKCKPTGVTVWVDITVEFAGITAWIDGKNTRIGARYSVVSVEVSG